MDEYVRVDVTVHFAGTADTVKFENLYNRDAQDLMNGLAVGTDGTTNVNADHGKRVVINRKNMTFVELERRST